MDKFREQVRKFLLDIPRTSQGHGCAHALSINKDNRRCTINGVICHAQFNTKIVTNPVSIGSGFLPSEAQLPILMRFWDWVTSDRSPWRLLVKDIELVRRDNDLPVGFIFSDKVVKELPFDFLKNFCILMRICTEKYSQLVIWDKLVNSGIEESDAFYLCGSLLNNTHGYSLNTFNLQGAHWPLTDFIGSYDKKEKFLDFEAYRTGKIHTNNSEINNPYKPLKYDQINGFFEQRKKSNRKNPFNLILFCKKKETKGRFTSVFYYELDDIIDGFYKWQAEEGIARDKT
jgi:hypothetical protein